MPAIKKYGWLLSGKHVIIKVLYLVNKMKMLIETSRADHLRLVVPKLFLQGLLHIDKIMSNPSNSTTTCSPVLPKQRSKKETPPLV